MNINTINNNESTYRFSVFEESVEKKRPYQNRKLGWIAYVAGKRESRRLMRTTGMMGEIVGMAASLCKQYNVKPRDIYHNYLNVIEGIGKKGLPNNQLYNEGGTLTTKPEIR
jgi:hypothetical protein